jgi:hypothetical protein
VEFKFNVMLCTCGRDGVHAIVTILANSGLLCAIMPSLYVQKLSRLKEKFSLRVISLFHQK